MSAVEKKLSVRMKEWMQNAISEEKTTKTQSTEEKRNEEAISVVETCVSIWKKCKR